MAARYLSPQVLREMPLSDVQARSAGYHCHRLLLKAQCVAHACLAKIRRAMRTAPFSQKVLNIAPLSLHPLYVNYCAQELSSSVLRSLIYQKRFVFVDHKCSQMFP